MSDSIVETPGAVSGSVRILLRCEGLALFLGACALYDLWGGSWWLFIALFLAPDLSFLAYLIGAKPGAMAYNAAHFTVVPIALMGISLALAMPHLSSIATIWLAHIGLDRALGYGLKYVTGFGFTHLGRIGRA